MRHAVGLVPGFLGFDHLGARTYFADRFVAALRAGIQARCDEDVAVVTTSTLPFGSLADRQERLVADLAKLGANLGGPTWHLVGHSTGGLDAFLLAGDKRLRFEAGTGTVFDTQAQTFAPLRSVTTVSAPIYGTCLALAPIASLLGGVASWDAARAAIEAVVDAGQHDELRSRLGFLWGALRAAGPGLLANGLARDLRPDRAGELGRTNAVRPGIDVFSIATVTPPAIDAQEDRLFRDLWRWTASAADGERDARPPAAWRRVIASDATLVPTPIGPRDNDGVVNTDRQLAGEPLALVLADHADVLGRYRRKDPLDAPGTEPVDAGILTSGAAFADDPFFEVVDCIAAAIATTIPSA